MNGKLPLPGSVTNFKGINLFAKEQELPQDNYRLYPHLRNQWTTFAFVEVDFDSIENIVGHLEDKKFLKLIKPNHHLSLVRGHFIVNHHHIKPLLESIRESSSIYRQFNICLTDLVVFKNENQSKCFLCLVDPNDHKRDLNVVGFCKALRDSILQFDFKSELNSTEQFNFHLSLAWCSAEHETQLNCLIAKLRGDHIVEPIPIKVKEFKVTVGNQEHKFYLRE